MTCRPAVICCALTATLIAGCERPRADYRIAVIPKGMTHEFWQSIHRGAVRAAEDLRSGDGPNVEVIWDGPLRERDALAQIRIVDRRVSAGAEAIVLAPQHSETMVAPVKRAVEQNVPVVIIDSGLEHPELTVKYVATDNRNGGRLAAKRLLQTLREEGKPAPRVVLFRYAVGSESTEQRENGFLDVIHEEIDRQTAAGETPIQLVSDDKYAGATKDNAMREASPLLNQFRDGNGNPTIDGIFCCNESSAEGMLDSLRSLGLERKVKLVGFDSGEPLMQALDEGTIDALILQDPYRMGYLGTWTAVQYLRGYDVVTEPNPHYLSTGEFVITKDNVHSEKTLGLYDQSAQARRKIDLPPVRKRP
ncbi:MAG TPA: substrate-binding domain-containing protein [Gemmataceae bacterium]|nr:substrate-binding domain-containing protein [Gemmataceae bacterium]